MILSIDNRKRRNKSRETALGIFLIASVLLSVDTRAQTSPAPGPLTQSSVNPYWFADPQGNVHWLAGDHSWANLQDLGVTSPAPAFPFTNWITYMTVHHFNHARLWMTMFSNAGIGNPTPTGVSGPCWPWQRVGPGTANDGNLKTDFTKLDDACFFARQRARVIQAGQNGIYLTVMLFDAFEFAYDLTSTDGNPFESANNVNGISAPDAATVTNCSDTTCSSLAANVRNVEVAYIQHTIDNLNDQPNVLWEVANEPGSAAGAGGTANTDNWQKWVIGQVHSYESTKPNRHPVVVNYFAAGDTAMYASGAEAVSVTSEFPSGYPSCPGSTCKPTINDSDHSAYYPTLESQGPAGWVSFVWKNFLNGMNISFMDPYLGGEGYGDRNCPAPGETLTTSGCVSVTNGQAAHEDVYWEPLRLDIQDAAIYANKIDLLHMIPQSGLSSSTYALSNSRVAGAIGIQYLVYDTLASFTVSLVAGTYSYEWFNPAIHAVAASGTITTGTSQTFTPPFSGNAVLLLTAQAQAVAVAISPTAATVASGGTRQFTATVTGTTNTSVTWMATAGSVSSSGLFTAPSVTANTTVTVKATSVADPTKSASATVTVTAAVPVITTPAAPTGLRWADDTAVPAVTISIAPTAASVVSGATLQLTAAVTGSANTAVTWTTTAGSVSNSGLFTAPTVTANTTVTVRATSQADTSKTASAAIMVVPPASGTLLNQGWTQIGTDANDALVNANDVATPGVHVCPDHPYDPSIYGGSWMASAGCQAVINQWSGGALKTDTNQMILFGGGHSGYGGDEIYLLDFTSNPPKWHRPFGPALPGPALCSSGAPCAGTACDLPISGTGASCSGGSTYPVSRHSVGGESFIPQNSDASGSNNPEFVAFGGAQAYQTGGGKNDVWIYDFTAGDWPAGNRYKANPSFGTDEESNFAEYDPVDKVVYLAYTTGFAMYNPSLTTAVTRTNGGGTLAANTFQKLNGTDPNSSSMYGTIDQANRNMVIVMKDSLDGSGFNVEEIRLSDGAVVFGPAGTAHGNPLPGCPFACAGYACSSTYDTNLNKVVIQANWTDLGIYIYDHATHSCTQETYGNNSAVSPANIAVGDIHGGSYGRFRYVPSKDYYVYVGSPFHAPWILCRKAGGCAQ